MYFIRLNHLQASSCLKNLDVTGTMSWYDRPYINSSDCVHLHVFLAGETLLLLHRLYMSSNHSWLWKKTMAVCNRLQVPVGLYTALSSHDPSYVG